MIKLLTQSFLVIFVITTFSCRSNETVVKKFQDGVYKGEVDKKGNKHGNGLIIWNDGSSYQGEFQKDLRHGNGLFNWENGESYEGEYTKDERTGIGIYRWPDGAKYEGSFLNGKRHGFGRFQTATGIIYEGQWHKDITRKIQNISHTNLTGSLGQLEKKNLPIPPGNLSEKKEYPIDAQGPKTVKSSENKSILPIKKPKATQPKVLNQIKDENNYLASQPAMESTGEVINLETELPKKVIVDKTNKKLDVTQVTPPINDEIIDSIPPQNGGNQVENKSILWTGTVEEAEKLFFTETIGGIDIVKDVETKTPFTGKMQIIKKNGSLLGEVNLLDGKLHGEEMILDEKGTVVERYFWNKGIENKF
jgi:hypothetical protein